MSTVRFVVRAVLFVAVVAPGTALAQTRICSYAVDDWVEDVKEIEAQLAVEEGEMPNLKESGILLEVMGREWECLSAPVPPDVLQLYAQIRAYQAFHSGDPDAALRWNRAQHFINPKGEWPAWVPDYHPLREQLEWESPAEVVTLEGKYVNHPKKGGVFMNGRYLQQPIAPSETPALVQVYDKKQNRVMIYWQEGTSFRPDLITEDAGVAAKAKLPKWWTPLPPATTGGSAVAATESQPAAEPEAEAAEAEGSEAEPEPEPEAEAEAEHEAEPEGEAEGSEAEPEPEAEGEAQGAADDAAEEPEAEVADAAVDEEEPAVFADLITKRKCKDDTSSDDLRTAVSWAIDKYVENDQRALDKAWAEAQEAAACLSKVVDRSAAIAMHKLQAYMAHHAGADAATVDILRVALELDPTLEVSDRVAPKGDPLLDLLETAREQGPLTKVSFDAPSGSAVYIDGAELNVRPASVPSLVQVQESGEITWSGWVLDGADAPEWLATATSDSD